MVEFYVQLFFAAALYPAFLMLLNAAGGFFMLSHSRKRSVFAWLCLVISTALVYYSLASVDSVPNGIAIHIISSCVFFVLLAQAFCRWLNIQTAHQKAFVFSAILVIQPLVNLTLLHYLGLPHFSDGFLSVTKPEDISQTGMSLLCLLEFARWILTLLLAIYFIIKQKAKRMLVIALLGFIPFAYWFHLWASGTLVS